MATRTYITSSTSKHVRVEWKCTKCQETVTAIDELYGEGTSMYSGRGKEKERKATYQAETDAYIQLQKLTQADEESILSYYIGLTCCCPKCKHKEVWAKSNYWARYYLLKIALAFFIIGLFVTLITFSGGWKYALCVMGVAIAPTVIYGVLALKDKKNAEIFQNMPLESKPHLVPFKRS